MAESIIIDLNNTTNVKFLVETTKETGYVVVKDFITLQKGKLYYLPIINKDLNLKNYTFCKIDPDLIDFINIGNINNGLVTVFANVHNFQLVNNTCIGELI